MPRDYAKERANYFKKPEQMANNASRKRARRLAEKLGIVKPNDGKDLGHKDGNPQNNSPSNLKAESIRSNRSYPRTKTASKKNPKD